MKWILFILIILISELGISQDLTIDSEEFYSKRITLRMNLKTGHYDTSSIDDFKSNRIIKRTKYWDGLLDGYTYYFYNNDYQIIRTEDRGARKFGSKKNTTSTDIDTNYFDSTTFFKAVKYEYENGKLSRETHLQQQGTEPYYRQEHCYTNNERTKTITSWYSYEHKRIECNNCPTGIEFKLEIDTAVDIEIHHYPEKGVKVTKHLNHQEHYQTDSSWYEGNKLILKRCRCIDQEIILERKHESDSRGRMTLESVAGTGTGCRGQEYDSGPGTIIKRWFYNNLGLLESTTIDGNPDKKFLYVK